MKRMAAALALLLSVCLRLPAVAGVSAASAVLLEPESGRILWEQDAHTPRPMASTTKLMTALLLAEALPADRVIEVPAQALPAEGSSMGLRAGDLLTVRALLAGMLLASGNDAANAAALTLAPSYEAFAARMNERAAALGMRETVFVTPSGLDEGAHAASAYDMALLGAAVLRVPLLRELCATRSMTVQVGERTVWLQNHNRLLSLYPEAIGLKTGFTKKAGRCLVSAAERDGVRLIAVTLSAPDDWNDHIRLYQQGFEQVESLPCPAWEAGSLPVAGGVGGTVPCAAALPERAVCLRGETLTVRREMPAFVFAPVSPGQVLGQAVLLAGEREIARVPVTAGAAVAARPQPTRWARWCRMCGQLLADIALL